MTRFLLIRHGATDAIGISIAGRAPGCHLNREGERQARARAELLAGGALSAIYTSPQERARETAEIIAAPFGLTPEISEALAEIDYGEWTGRQFSELEQVAEWRLFNSFRAGTRIPGGEMMLEVQARVAEELRRLHGKHRDGWLALVSHADVIRCAIGYYAGIPIDLLRRLAIAPASVSAIAVDDRDAQVLCINADGTPAAFAGFPGRDPGPAKESRGAARVQA
jgi:broad specificity phosphatase PhoE